MRTIAIWQRWLLIPAVMLALSALCYWPALRGEFVWDDENLVANNPYIRSPVLVGEMFRHWLQPTSNAPYYRPIQTISLAADYYFWGQTPLGYHLTNVALHAACGALLFLLLRRLLRSEGTLGSGLNPDWFALSIAALWLVHPIHNAAVAYISGRADPLGFLFACGAWLLCLQVQEWKRFRSLGYASAALLMLAALCSKEISAVWLGLFAAHTAISQRLTLSGKLARVAACLVILGVWLLMRQLPVEPGLPAEAIQTSMPQRIVLVTRAVADYASLIVLPGELHMERSVWPEWYTAKTNWSNFLVHMGWTGWIGVLVICFVIAACALRGPGQRLRIAGSVWFVAAFLPISNVIPLNAQAAEHWIYLASVGALVFLAGILLLLPQRLQKAGICFLLLWGLGFAIRTNLRAADWRDPVAFYTQTIASMGGTPRIFNNLGTELQRRGRTEEAERVYRAALERYPNAPSLLQNLGELLGRKGLKSEAERYFTRTQTIASTRKGPSDDRALTRAIAGKARIALQNNRPQVALDLLKPALASGNSPWELTRLECEALVKLERWDEALAKVRQRTEKVWWDQNARSLLARMLERTGDSQQSEQEWRQAARLDVWDPEPWVALSRISQRKGDLFAAVRYQGEAVERAPTNIEARFVLAALLREAGRHEEASEELLKARYLQAGGEL